MMKLKMIKKISIKTKLGWGSAFENRGKICSQNKIVLAVLCHRVIRSDGSMGGFSSVGGISLKQKLLDFESSWKQ